MRKVVSAAICDGPTGLDSGNLVLVAESDGTPVYVYDLSSLARTIEDVRGAFGYSDFELLFATMANSNDRILRFLGRSNVGACVNSFLHLNKALTAGFRPDKIHFTSSGIPSAEMSILRTLGIAVNLDSPMQVERWALTAGASRVGLRVNAASLGLPHGRVADRMGMAAADVSDVVSTARRRSVVVDGLHVYVGTNFARGHEMLPTLERFFDLAATIDDLSYVNIGGGIGIDYSRDGVDFGLQEFGRSICELSRMVSTRVGRSVKLIFEPGRGLIAGSGVFLTTVTDVKQLGGIRYIAVDSSVAIFPRPLVHPDAVHRVRCLSKHGGSSESAATIVGRTTFSRDILGKAFLPDEVRPGDVLAFEDAGAYSESMASRCLGQREPQSVILDGR